MLKVWVHGEKVNASDLNAAFANLGGNLKFGGDGSDGAQNISSGTTTVDLGGNRVKILQYTSLLITGTGQLNFTNPHASGTIIIIKVQGNITITSSNTPCIDASGCGAQGGTGGSVSSANQANGTDGTDVDSLFHIKTNKGTKGQIGTPGAGGAVYTQSFNVTTWYQFLAKFPKLFLGAGGGGGSIDIDAEAGAILPARAGNGGRGGAALIIECAGSLNFTTSNGISVAGAVGETAPTFPSGYSDGSAAGGGGGGGGFCALAYNDLIASSGTINSSGGVGGNCFTIGGGGNTSEYGGGGGGSITAGSDGITSDTSGTKTGGDGGNGLSFIFENTECT